ncbi:MAG TPA: nucleoside hydrolase [Ardenticatenaceae bacterium]|nr:nucleoside hydrolase [Ardenticatenaceae bacterium]
MEPIKLLLDTDIDILGDIDDALCLAYLLAQPACEVVGITTATYDTHRRALVASALCRAAGKDIPILPGASTPLLAPLPVFPPQEGPDEELLLLERWDHARTFPQGEAVEFMRRTIREHPGEIILLAVAAYTNVALLFSVDPEIPRLLKGLVLMGGLFTTRPSGLSPFSLHDWNAQVDPHATAIVYRAPVALHRSIGLNITQHVTMDAEAFWRAFQPSRLHPMRDFAEAWFRQRPTITFHDPLAATTIFDPSICRFETGTVEVELASVGVDGLTYWVASRPEPRHEIAVAVDTERFFEHFFSVLR